MPISRLDIENQILMNIKYHSNPVAAGSGSMGDCQMMQFPCAHSAQTVSTIEQPVHSKRHRGSPQYCVICLHLDCIEDGWLIEQINRAPGANAEERLKNYLYQVSAPDSIPSEPVILDQTIRRRRHL